jgi:sulfite exporter TauE/SafE
LILGPPWSYGGFNLIIWYGLFLGVLHTIMPCEDKFIFCFYAFGVARDRKQALRIVNYYGLGLFGTNLFIGIIISWFGAAFSYLITINPLIWNTISSFTLILSGIIMLIQIRKNLYWPHGDQLKDLTRNLGTLRKQKKTAFILGILAGIPPCLFEFAIYTHAVTLSAQYGWGNGVWTIFFFGIGTWIGLYPLTLIGTMSGKLSKALRETSLQQIQAKLKFNKIRNKLTTTSSDPEESAANSDIHFSSQSSKNSIYTKIEVFSAIALIIFGVLYFILALYGIPLIPFEDIPEGPFPLK